MSFLCGYGMQRVQLFELEDQAWLPAAIRDGITDFLQFAVARSGLYRRTAPVLAAALQQAGCTRLVDLCSGAGGPWSSLLPQIRDLTGWQHLELTLTDYYPNTQALSAAARADASGRTRYIAEPVSAFCVPADLQGFRTLFSSFHHFRPQDAQTILADAVRQRQGIAIVESTQRHPLLIAYMLLTPLLVWLTTPWQRPWRWSRLFWTYLIPVVPMAVMFDGIVSCLRTYTPSELLALVRQVQGHGSFDWQTDIVRIGRLPVGVTYLVGVPKPSHVATGDIQPSLSTAISDPR